MCHLRVSGLDIVSENLAAVKTARLATVVFDVVPPKHASLCLEMFRKLGVFEVTEVHERCDMTRSSVLLRLLNYF